MKLVSHGYLQGFYYKPRVDKELLAKHSEGLICLSACLSGEVCSNLVHEQYDSARRAAGDYLDIFGRDRFYIEVQDQGLEVEHRINPQLIRLAKELDVPMVATNDCHYVTKEDSRAHEVLLCIQTGKTMSDNSRMRFSNDQFYVKTQEEMVELFRDLPDSLSRTLEIAERCNFTLEKATQPFPHFEVPGDKSLDAYFEEVVWKGYEERLPYLTRMQTAGAIAPPPGGLPGAAGERDCNHQADEVPRLFHDRLGFHSLRPAKHIPVGPGPRLSSRQFGVILPEDHRSRSHPIWSAV